MNGNTAYLIHHSKAKWRVAVRFPPLFLPNMKKVLFFCKRRFYKGVSTKGPRPANTEEVMIHSTLDAVRHLIATLNDEEKLTLLTEQLEGPLCFDSQDAVDLMCEVVDAYGAVLNHVEEAIADSLTDKSDDYDGGRYDFYTTRGVK